MKFSLIFLTLILFSCHKNRIEDITNVMSMAGENKEELDVVINHYKKDSFAYEAALYLIANLSYHHSYSAWQIDSLKQLKKMSISKGRIPDSILAVWKDFDYRKASITQDVRNITANILIENIDYAIMAWRNRKWNKHYSFLDFCEYVLPYRVGDEPLEKWRKMYYEKYTPILDSLYHGDDAVEAAKVLANYLKKEGFSNYTDFLLPHLGASFLFKNRVGYCRENCDIAMYVMRSVGIPVATDFYEISPSYDSRHFWTAVIDTNHHAIPFNYTEKEISRTRQEERKKGKVYRICFSRQEGKKNSYNDLPVFFKQNLIKDVTEEYFPHTFVHINMQQSEREHCMYLSVFSKNNYVPIDISENGNGIYRFKGIEQGLVYFPTWYKDNHMLCATYPFLLTNNVPKFLIPNFSKKEKVCLKRKYPLLNGRDFIKNIYMAKIEASNTKDFKHPILLHEFKDIPKTNRLTITTNIKRRYRYIRYTAPRQKKIELGEFYAYEKGKNSAIPPISITSSEELDSIHIQDLHLMMDGVWDSFYMSRTTGASLTFDYGSPVFIERFIVIPRNDDNYIHIGDTYELFYHQGKMGWKSLGKKKATSVHICFSSVPSNALLWLHNHTRGTEERPFYMENGEQKFP